MVSHTGKNQHDQCLVKTRHGADPVLDNHRFLPDAFLFSDVQEEGVIYVVLTIVMERVSATPQHSSVCVSE